MTDSRCVASVITPDGRGAVATVVILGPSAAACVAAHFRVASGKPLDTAALNRIVFGRWQSSGNTSEEVVVCRREHDRVEVHCHGGRAAAKAIVRSLLAQGCSEVPWQAIAEYGLSDAVAAEAIVALPQARTERTAAILLDQFRGAMSQATREIMHLLEQNELKRARSQLESVRRLGRLGLHLIWPFRVVLAGPTNVGKSSLINVLLGYERAIVFDTPGTTRDVVSATTAIDGWPVELADTAGLRQNARGPERAGVYLAHQQLKSADLVVLVFDATEPWTDDLQRLIDFRPDALLVHNKCERISTPLVDRPSGLETSALTGEGIEMLSQAISQRLVPEPPPPGSPVPFNERQLSVFEAALRHLDEGNANSAIQRLSTISASPSATTSEGSVFPGPVVM